MPKELRDVHAKNDNADTKAYAFSMEVMSEADYVATLMKMYQELTSICSVKIITVENPINNTHEDKTCLIDQQKDRQDIH